MNQQPPQNSMPVTAFLGEEESKTKFSNMVQLGHSPEDFLFDFYHTHSPSHQARLQSRIALTPSHAKRLLELLQASIEKYEKTYGTIRTAVEPQRPIGFHPQRDN